MTQPEIDQLLIDFDRFADPSDPDWKLCNLQSVLVKEGTETTEPEYEIVETAYTREDILNLKPDQ